ASAVADFMLQDPNVQQSRLRVYGFADTRPAADNDTREGRAENRRIEIEIGQ
ncbi:MAG: flagellar motor protein, partial [Gammaproteobacteria bacterium]|nr:flagellar motor protein [Gammaproteobacteria bacterium]